MATTAIPKSTFEFFSELEAHNNRDWFNDHKDWYKKEHQAAKHFIAELTRLMQSHDVIESHKLFRIYRDVRFSKNKSPYKTNWGVIFSREGAYRRGGYYLSIGPGQTFAGGGFYSPNKEDLELIRKKVDQDPDSFRKVLTDPLFVQTYSELQGETVKTAPKGYTKDHPAIDLLRYKQMYAMHQFSDAEAQKPDFLEKVNETFKAIRPFFDHMTEVLTTDMNGVPLYG
ncbi:MAG: DUF2461 domain-containing protein [Phaeodactylibacter sp.]|nr:DUF2461 domain-containing protein [Phaeodactylibacter sp.]